MGVTCCLLFFRIDQKEIRDLREERHSDEKQEAVYSIANKKGMDQHMIQRIIVRQVIKSVQITGLKNGSCKSMHSLIITLSLTFCLRMIFFL